MKQALATLLAAAFLLIAGPSGAGPIEDSIVRQLRAQGFAQIEVSRTWLGRSRIVATSPRVEREIVVNPVTGEILRDFSAGRHERGSPNLLGPGQGGGSTGGDDRDGDDGDGDADGDGDGEGDGDGGDGDGDGGGDD